MTIFKNSIYIFILSIFSFFINYYYSSLGVLSQDTFAYYDTGYRVLNGDVPFKDYWTVSGPLIDYLQAIFFYFLGVNWNAYVLNGSLLNAFISILFYQLLKSYKLNDLINFFYSICFSILANPSMGVPFPDHYSVFLSLSGIFFFLIAIQNQKYHLWFITPILFFFSFFSKQTPSVYLFIIIVVLCVLYIILFKKIDFAKYLISSALMCFCLFIAFVHFNKIDTNQLLEQYFFFAQTIGQNRLKELRITLTLFLNFKFIYIFLFFIIFKFFSIILNFKNSLEEKRNILLIVFLITLTSFLIFHQILTKNFIFIYFLIPLLGGFTHIFYFNKKKEKKYLEIFLILLTLFSTVKYHLRFNEHRKMLNLETVDLRHIESGELIDSSLKGLKWITIKYSQDPLKEIKMLKEVLKILKADTSKKMVTTDYLFFSAILNENLNNPSRWPSINDASNPSVNNKFHKNYINFIENLIEKKNIETLYTTIDSKEDIFNFILKNSCKQKKVVSELLIKYDIKNCKKIK